ncbi:hypothetical protein BGX31_011471, partial [Mortierella sp. GBA43]
YHIQRWLFWLKSHCNFTAEKFMVDCAITESEAIRAIFPESSIYYCHFHVGQIWERNMKESCVLKDHDKMRPLLKAMRTASSEEQLNSLWSHFKAQFPRAKKFITFIEKSWMTSEKKSKWTVFVRENYQHIDTNNLVESWHKTLKRHHLGKERNLRADFVVYLLQGAVDRDFRMTYLKINRGVQPLRLSQYDKKRKGRAMELSLDIARIMITVNLDEGKRCN